MGGREIDAMYLSCPSIAETSSGNRAIIEQLAHGGGHQCLPRVPRRNAELERLIQMFL